MFLLILCRYPIYRIPVGPTLQDLGACFLTFHSLSTPLQSPTTINCSRKDKDISSKLSLPIFGLAFTKFKISVWDPEGDSEDQKANSLRRAADNWIRQLQVNHPDYKFFSTNYSYCRWAEFSLINKLKQPSSSLWCLTLYTVIFFARITFKCYHKIR